jgi:hypothetical protein
MEAFRGLHEPYRGHGLLQRREPEDSESLPPTRPPHDVLEEPRRYADAIYKSIADRQ